MVSRLNVIRHLSAGTKGPVWAPATQSWHPRFPNSTNNFTYLHFSFQVEEVNGELSCREWGWGEIGQGRTRMAADSTDYAVCTPPLPSPACLS